MSLQSRGPVHIVVSVRSLVLEQTMLSLRASGHDDFLDVQHLPASLGKTSVYTSQFLSSLSGCIVLRLLALPEIATLLLSLPELMTVHLSRAMHLAMTELLPLSTK